MEKKKIKVNNIVQQFGKGFSEPFLLSDYYKSQSPANVFKEVKCDIECNLYRVTFSTDPRPSDPARVKSLQEIETENFIMKRNAEEIAEKLNKLSEKELTDELCFYAHNDPKLFERNDPLARQLVAYFGKILNRYYRASKDDDRNSARDALNKIMKRPLGAHWRKKVDAAPHLSRSDMYDYLHKITETLQTKYAKKGHKALSDPQFSGVEEDDLVFLLYEPKQFTTNLMARFFEMKPSSLEKLLAEERKQPTFYHPKKYHS